MISQALAANVPFSWVAADSVYGVGDIEMALRHAGKGYVLGVSANRHDVSHVCGAVVSNPFNWTIGMNWM
jgi:SRSO17 transposase